jgi:mitochondrial fission protein ELM1
VQSRGLVRELSKTYPLSVTEVPIQCALPRCISRSLVKRLLRRVRRGWMFRLLHPCMKLPEGTPDLIVSSGPLSLAALEFLAKHHKAQSVFVQGTIAVPQGAVTVVMRPFEGEPREDYVFIPLLFTEITPQVVEEAGEVFLKQNAVRLQGPVNVLFIGSSSAKIRFSQEDWHGVIRFVNDLWKREGRQWLITTSYRTGRELEQLFMQGIVPDAILDVVWYSQAPRKVTKAFLGLADRVFVTMDSLTMITEAVASGRPTVVLCPADLPKGNTNTHLQYVRNLAADGFISLVRTGRDEGAPPVLGAASEIDYSDAIHELTTRLRWNA